MMLRYCTNVEKLCVSKVKKEKILVAYGGSFPPALTIEGNKKESMYARLRVKRVSSKVLYMVSSSSYFISQLIILASWLHGIFGKAIDYVHNSPPDLAVP